MKRILMVPLILMSLVVLGCANSSKSAYRNQIREFETAYQKNEISKAEYLKLKMESENAYEHRKATIKAGKLAAPS